MLGVAIELKSRDGEKLSKRLASPDTAKSAVLVIAPAMVVPQSFHDRLIESAIAEDFAVQTLVYRTMEVSRTRPLEKFSSSILEWGRQCLTVAIDHASIGHSNFFGSGASKANGDAPSLGSAQTDSLRQQEKGTAHD